MKNIILVQRILPHYRVSILNRLGKKYGEVFKLIFGQKADSSYFINEEKKLCINSIKVRNKWFPGNKFLWQNIFSSLLKINSINLVIVEHNIGYLPLVPLIIYLKIKRIPVLLWGHGGSRSRPINSNHPLDFIHRTIIKNVDGYICYTEGIKKNLANIVPEDRLFVATNTLDSDTLIDLRFEMELRGVHKTKISKGITNEYIALFIGRLISEKRVDIFFDTIKGLQEDGWDIGGIIIGDGQEKSNLIQYVTANNVKDIHFLGAISDWEKSAPYLFLSDVMLMPGAVGLAVNHAFCFGLPVCTIESPPTSVGHGPEVEFIKNGETGIKARCKKDLKDAVKEILLKHKRYSDTCKKVADSTISADNMVNGFQKAINHFKSE